MKIKLVFLFVVPLLYYGCANLPKSRSTYLLSDATQSSVFLYTQDTPVSSEATLIKSVKISPPLFMVNCDSLQHILNRLKMQTSNLGGNIVKIRKYAATNGFGSECHKIRADILYSNRPIENKRSHNKDSNLFVYRYGGAVLLKPELVVGNRSLGKVKARFSKEFNVSNRGETVIYLANSNDSDTLRINITDNKKYFVKVGIKYGGLAGRAFLQLVDEEQGEIEYSLYKNSYTH